MTQTEVRNLVGSNGVPLFADGPREKPSLDELFAETGPALDRVELELAGFDPGEREELLLTDLALRAEELNIPIVTMGEIAEACGELDAIHLGRKIRDQLHGKPYSAGHALTIGGEEFVLLHIIAREINPGEIITAQTPLCFEDWELTAAQNINRAKAE